MYPLISNISLPEAKQEVIYFSWYFCLSKRYTLGIMSQRFKIYYHYSHKRKLFHILSFGMSISITFFFLYEMSVYWSVSIWYAWGERRIILSVDCSPQYESGRTPSPPAILDLLCYSFQLINADISIVLLYFIGWQWVEGV